MSKLLLKSYKFPGTNKILAEIIQAQGNSLCSEVHKCINFILNKEELPQQWKETITVSIHPIFFSQG
jgi:hypothetical protein